MSQIHLLSSIDVPPIPVLFAQDSEDNLCGLFIGAGRILTDVVLSCLAEEPGLKNICILSPWELFSSTRNARPEATHMSLSLFYKHRNAYFFSERPKRMPTSSHSIESLDLPWNIWEKGGFWFVQDVQTSELLLAVGVGIEHIPPYEVPQDFVLFYKTDELIPSMQKPSPLAVKSYKKRILSKGSIITIPFGE